MVELEKKVLEWARVRGILIHSSSILQVPKLKEELDELYDGLDANDIDEIRDAIGDILVVLTIIAHLEGMDLTECYSQAYEEIKDRKGYMNAQGIFVKEV